MNQEIDRGIIKFGILTLIGILALIVVVLQITMPSISDLCIPYTGIEESGDEFSGLVGGCL
jgi:hypothetical protein